MSFPWEEDYKQATREDAPDYDDSTIESIHQRMKEAGEDRIAEFLKQQDEEEAKRETRYLSDK